MLSGESNRGREVNTLSVLHMKSLGIGPQPEEIRETS